MKIRRQKERAIKTAFNRVLKMLNILTPMTAAGLYYGRQYSNILISGDLVELPFGVGVWGKQKRRR
ncbi:MAG: hypothetical protein L6437_00685 [Kiritimatiellae bacterium]|nr:hypothetical protein [Verrucomicrobiota bacterium]MCG2658747.1 hypothetical protein [Kiritimatiellia bacterium]